MANLNAFDLNLLRVLDALLREGSTVRAGARLGLSQPAVSAALGRLRAGLGDELFFRPGQGLQATAFAQGLEAEVRSILDRIEGVLQGPSAFNPVVATERFRLSGSDYFAELLMPALAVRLARVAPSVMVHLVDVVADSHIGSMEAFDIDLALIPQGPLPDWVEQQTLMRSGFVVVARKEHPRLARAGVAPGQVIPLDLFCDLGHVLFSPEGKAKALGDAALARVGRSRRVVMTMPVFSGVYRAVAGSDLIALLPGAYAGQVAPTAGLETYLPPMPVDEVTLTMVWHKRFSNSAAHLWLRGQVKDLMAPFDLPPAVTEAGSRRPMP